MVPLFTCYERKWESFFPQSSMWCLQCCFLSNDVFIPSELGWWIKQKMAVEIVIIVIVKPPSSVASGSQTWSIFPENEVDIRVRYCAYLKTKTENCTKKNPGKLLVEAGMHAPSAECCYIFIEWLRRRGMSFGYFSHTGRGQSRCKFILLRWAFQWPSRAAVTTCFNFDVLGSAMLKVSSLGVSVLAWELSSFSWRITQK